MVGIPEIIEWPRKSYRADALLQTVFLKKAFIHQVVITSRNKLLLLLKWLLTKHIHLFTHINFICACILTYLSVQVSIWSPFPKVDSRTKSHWHTSVFYTAVYKIPQRSVSSYMYIWPYRVSSAFSSPCPLGCSLSYTTWHQGTPLCGQQPFGLLRLSIPAESADLLSL